MRWPGLIPSFLCITTPLAGQWQVTGDVGVAHLRQSGIPESSALTAAATFDASGDRSLFRSSVLAAAAPNGDLTVQGLVLASFFGAPRAVRWELSPMVSAFGQTAAGSATSAELLARVHAGAADGGLVAGVGGGAVNDYGGGHALYHAQANLWRTMNEDRFDAGASLVGAAAPRRSVGGEQRASYVDASATWRRENGNTSFGATVGLRARVTGELARSDGWGSIDGSVWIDRQVAVVGSAGRTLADLVRGVPATQYVSVALRVAARPHAGVPPTSIGRRQQQIAASRDGIVIRIEGASTVELRGDFTGWEMVSLQPDGAVWRLRRTLSPGLHRVVIRIDGGDWTPPFSLPRATDDLGGLVGLITVP